MFESVKDKIRASSGGQLPFESSIASLKQKLALIAENKKMGADILFMMTYMASMSMANATRPEIFAFASQREEYISSKYIAKVDTFVKKWSFSYSESLSIVAERTTNPTLQNMLMRYANAIESNVPDDEFLSQELNTIRSVYRSQYEQGCELVKKWGDAYVAMLLSGTVIAVTIMISIAIYSPTGMEGTLNMSYGIILAICAFGVILMYQSVPGDPKTHGLTERASKEQITIRTMERVILPITVVIGLVILVLGVPVGLIYLMIGIFLAPLGIIGFIDDHNITLRDNDFATFIRSFGSIMGGQSATAVHALGAIDRKSFMALEDLLNSVYSKMNLGLEVRPTWDRFIGESGSNLINMYLNIYLDTVQLGGPPEPIGKTVGSSMLEMVLLRDKKDMIARGFILLMIPMHVVMAAIFVALYRIMVTLTTSVGTMMQHFQETTAAAGASSASGAGGVTASGTLGAGMGMFTNFPEKEMGIYVAVILTIITISNILAAKIVGGGDRYMYYFYAAIFCILTGLVMVVTPMIVGIFFNPEALTNMSGR
ncbi:MAG: flagellar assembly protein J [Methanoregula sp. PtaU1.Bin051]|nr:MAG: flagellar assembly protein J [Methanoregula sp. PtaU1.Bin051]